MLVNIRRVLIRPAKQGYPRNATREEVPGLSGEGLSRMRLYGRGLIILRQ